MRLFSASFRVIFGRSGRFFGFVERLFRFFHKLKLTFIMKKGIMSYILVWHKGEKNERRV